MVAVLEQVTQARGKPASIRLDNGPEFISKSLDWWAYFNEVKLDFSRPGKPDRQRLHRVIQRPLAARMLERTLVLELGRCPGEARCLARRLQSTSPAQCPGQCDPGGIRGQFICRQSSLCSPCRQMNELCKTCIPSGPRSQASSSRQTHATGLDQISDSRHLLLGASNAYRLERHSNLKMISIIGRRIVNPGGHGVLWQRAALSTGWRHK